MNLARLSWVFAGSSVSFPAGLLAGSLAAATPCLADPPIAGESLYTVSHGQPFCTSRGALEALLRAQIAHADLGFGFLGPCRYLEDNDIVAVAEDLSGGRYMHIVRARANPLFFPIEGYTYSVGLYPYPVRSTPLHLNPFY